MNKINKLIKSLGIPDKDNEYIIKADKNGEWWIEHKHVGSGEPLKQWLEDNLINLHDKNTDDDVAGKQR